MSITAYPLTWPAAFARTAIRERGAFKTTLHAALDNVEGELRRFSADSRRKVANVVISSNVTLGANRPADPGVAVWFEWDGLGLCIAVDRYQTVEANLQAIYHIIAARRVELRHGTLALVRATFQGFKALPAPPGSEWWTVLGVSQTATVDEIQAAHRRLAAAHHPDRGGDASKMAAINVAYDAAQAAHGRHR